MAGLRSCSGLVVRDGWVELDDNVENKMYPLAKQDGLSSKDTSLSQTLSFASGVCDRDARRICEAMLP